MFKQILGIIFVIVGVLAFFVPLIPGGILVYIGLEILGVVLLKNKILEWKLKYLATKTVSINDDKKKI